MACTFELESRSVKSFRNLYKKGNLNLTPVFQRQSVWKPIDREKLINSIYKGFPLPAIFLYKHQHDGKVVYEVIDGKQRLESILTYIGAMRKAVPSFVPRIDLDNGSTVRTPWREYPSQSSFLNYRLPVLHVSGDLGDINDLFVCINSTGTTLTGAEKRHAKYLNSPFLKAAEKLAAEKQTYLIEKKILNHAQIQRMKHVELVCELMLSVHIGNTLDKKKALDRLLKAGKLSEKDAKDARRFTLRTFRIVDRICFSSNPGLPHTRFAKVSDFYSLFVLLHKLDQEGVVTKDKAANQWAWRILRRFALGVDDSSDKYKSFKSTAGVNKLYVDYLKTVQHGSDQKAQRQRREKILDGLIRTILPMKDQVRAFSPEQRRVLWNSTSQPKCSICGGSRGELTWNNCDIDHRKPYTLGGLTDLSNAGLAHRSCNLEKGAKY